MFEKEGKEQDEWFEREMEKELSRISKYSGLMLKELREQEIKLKMKSKNN